jgi:hypothetical protein
VSKGRPRPLGDDVADLDPLTGKPLVSGSTEGGYYLSFAASLADSAASFSFSPACFMLLLA